jgi:alpha-1,3-rhamnosyl/mannosyltransferase
MILAAVARTAHTLLADTHWQASRILEVFPVAASKLHVVPIPCDPCFGPPLPSEIAHVERPYILSVGTLEPRKNIDRLITAWKNSGLDLDLVLAGRWGWRFESLKKILAGLRELPHPSGCECWELEDGRHITRYQFLDGAVLRNLYQRAACLVYPSLFEGFGLPVLEAMACGCPVLTSSESAMAEVAGESGWYFDPLDTRSISRTIEEALSRGPERNRRIGLGLERAKTFSAERLAEDLLRVYQD